MSETGIVTALLARLANVANATVHDGRRFFDAELDRFPALTLFPADENADVLTWNAYRCAQTYIVEAWAIDADTPAATLRDLKSAIQQAVETDSDLGGAAHWLRYRGVPDIEIPASGSRVCRLQLAYEVEYDRDHGA